MVCYSKKTTPKCQWPNIANYYFLFTRSLQKYSSLQITCPPDSELHPGRLAMEALPYQYKVPSFITGWEEERGNFAWTLIPQHKCDIIHTAHPTEREEGYGTCE